MKKRVFSGIQSTGNVHIGNYLGALKNWVELQDEYDTIYCVVDLHAMTTTYNPADLARDRLEAAKILLAAGVDPDRSLLYYQSQVPQHPELSWILSVDTPLGALNRMTQFKEKTDKSGGRLGLYAYPVLMAADILVHKAHLVPVGEDQTQHVELTRDIAVRFNGRYGEEFPIPEQITPEQGARVMSLQDPRAKMSKSDSDPNGRILVVDEPDAIVRKIKRAVTDSGTGVEHDPKAKPGIANLLDILSAFTDLSVEKLLLEHGDKQYGALKEVVAEAVVAGLAPLRRAYKDLEDEEVRRVMLKGALDARTRAEREMVSVRRKVGLAS